MELQSKITAKGQTTIPQEVRDHLHLKPGDRLSYVMNGPSVLLVARNRDIATLAGFLGEPPAGAGATLEDLDKAVGDAVSEDDERIRNQSPGRAEAAE